MSLTVYAPCFNEIFYAKAWYENVRKLNPEIIIADTGSTDGSLEFFQNKPDVSRL
jgi:glycosyltransferase involved in cell wall biosynthesis